MDAGFDRTKRRGLTTRGEAFTDAGGYPQRIAGVYDTGGGPNFGSGLTIGTAAEQYEDRVQQWAEESATN